MKYLFLLIILVAFACKPDLSNPEIKKLYDEVMLIHDEVMPEISTIHSLRKSLKSKFPNDSIGMSLVKQLEDADEGMMSWMANFGKFRKMENEPDSVKLDYLFREKNRIIMVSDEMKLSIKKAQLYLGTQNLNK